MSRRDRMGMWVWRVTFASFAALVFGGFCVFWARTFEGPEPGVAQAALVDVRLPAAVDCNSGLSSKPMESLPPVSDDFTDLDAALEDEVLEEDTEVAVEPARKSIEDIIEAKRAAAETVMFQSRISGPYALSIRDNLNEMVIGTSLAAEGLGDQRLDRVLNSIPSQLPTHGYISSGFGFRRSPFTHRRVHHNGVDFAVPRGSPVYATADGTVAYSGWAHGFGKLVMIDHGYGIVTRYGHNSQLVARVGDHVTRGDVIAKAGSTGRSTGSHVHYEVWINDHAIDPSRFMFDIPDRAGPVLAMNPYKRDVEETSLGLGMGGDSSVAPRLKLAKPPTDLDRSAGNLGIMGIFALGTFWLAYSLIPGRAALRKRTRHHDS